MNGPGFDGWRRQHPTVRPTIEPIQAGIAVFTPDRRLEFYNDAFPELIGLSRNRLPIGLTYAELMSALRQRPGTAAFQWERHNGRMIEVRSETLSNERCVIVVTDITRIRDTQDAVLLSRCAAEAAEAAKARFLASVSTGLRTPLLAILAETAALAAAPRSTLDNAQAAETIETAARSLLGLLDGILELARLETGRFELADDCVDLSRLLRSILRRFDQQAAAAEITLVVDLPLSLPTVRADETRLRQVVSDVVANALAVSGPFGSVSICARHDWAGGGLLLQVQDTGPGIAEQDLARVFEPYFQWGGAEPGA